MRLSAILCFVLAFAACSTESPEFANLDFEDECTDASTGLCDWEISYQARCEILSDSTSGSNVLRINGESGVCFIEQILQLPEKFDESILTMSTSIKTVNVSGKGAGLNIGVYNADSIMILNADMGYSDYNYASGTEDWSRYTIQAVVPAEAASARLGIISFGEGVTLFDSVTATFESVSNRRPSDYASAYVSAAIEMAEEHSLRRDSVDFDQVRKSALRIAGDAQEAEDLHLATRYILSSLGDHHSFLMTASDRRQWLNADGENAAAVTYTTAEIYQQFGHLWIPGFHGNDEQGKKDFAQTLQRQIRELYQRGVKGWIVDLRDNDGGNMAPMLAGLEPLFASDTLGYLVDVGGTKEVWGRGEGIRKANIEDYVDVDAPVRLDRQLPIAVLYDGSTGSSGEIVIISFIGHSNARSFGTPSMGLTTGNGEFELPDGSYMYMASTRMADRNGTVYEGPIVPDEVVEGSDDEILQAAVDWLMSNL